MMLQAYRQVRSSEITGGKLVSGHLVGDVAQQSGGTDPPVSKFDVPDDKRLLQLSTTRLTARSSLGRAISQAVTTLQNYYVQDTGGGRYKIVGKYAVASTNGTQVFEVQYFKDPVGSIGGLGAFNSIDESKLTATDQFVLLFLVDPGARIVSFSTGGSASRQDDLTADNLVAPQ